MRYRKEIKKAADRVLSLLFPRRCPICDRVLPYGDRICGICAAGIEYETEPRCMKCGRSFEKDEDPGRIYCGDCEAHAHVYDHGYCLARYHSVAKALYRLKYQNRRDNAEFFGDEMVSHLGRELAGLRADVLVPVPLHKKRLKKRGYNQAEDLAKRISARTGIPVRNDLVIRKVNTAPMKKSDSIQTRRNNLKNAFQLAVNDVQYDKIVIIDDIYTSGSTIDAVAGELRKAGVPNIYFMAVAGTHR